MNGQAEGSQYLAAGPIIHGLSGQAMLEPGNVGSAVICHWFGAVCSLIMGTGSAKLARSCNKA